MNDNIKLIYCNSPIKVGGKKDALIEKYRLSILSVFALVSFKGVMLLDYKS